MASSSSSSHSIPASASQSWKHEVFLSFRGEDTRKGFVDHLYEALVQRGIQTYKDDETLPRGARIGPSLHKAIQESRIAVIVFSENYADSSWCLDELTHIVECMEKIGQIVMPVFYDVDPSYVRKLKRKYGEAFTKHEGDHKHKIDSWREALVKAGNLSGWVLKDFANGREAICIRDIVAKISSRLPPLHTYVNKKFIGIETRLQDLKSKLDIGSGGVRMVGIWGVGGGGKTTLASAAYMEISRHFEASCLLENIRDESSKNGLTKLQEKFLSLVTKTNEVIGSEIEGINMIKRKLCCKSVLVVLDDVNERKQLEALAGSHDWFGEGSRIIITTRDEHLLTRQADMIYEVSLLSHDEALKLFNGHAYRKDKPVEDYEVLSEQVISYANGLPLALEVLGSFLYDKDNAEWRSVLAKLKDIPYPEVTKRLKISYDGLEHGEKQLFLDIACFFRRVKIDEAMPVLDACSFQPRIGIKVLAQKSLIKVSNGRFDMHDLLEEMAHYIVRGEHPDDPEKHSRIWKEEDIVNLFDTEEVASSMETEVLRMDYHDVITKNLFNVIAKMKKLRWIDWEWYLASSFPSNFQQRNLGCLNVRFSNLEQLWEGFKSLPRLKILDLFHSSKLERTPDLNGLPCLERLNLCNCVKLEDIHPSIGYHERLVWVNMERCEKLKSFPPIIKMRKLETLVLSGCFRLEKFPEIQTHMDSLINLHLDKTIIELVPPSVGQFCTNLAYFDLENCVKLKRIEGNFRLLKRLKHLKISECIQLKRFAEDFFADECCLEELPEFSWLSIVLDLSRAGLGDGDMPYDMSGFVNLQVLDLRSNNFSKIPSSLSQIPCLKFLDLSGCENLVEVSDLPSSIEILMAEDCESLERVGDLSNCKWLWKVSFLKDFNFKKLIIDDERLIHSMLQRNAADGRFTSIMLPTFPWLPIIDKRMTTLKLPLNWYNDFSGFLLLGNFSSLQACNIVINREMSSTNSQPDHWEEFDKIPESYNECRVVGYVPFGSLRHASWWNPTCTHITFHIEGLDNPKVGLFPRKSKSRETPIHYYSKCWEETRYPKTFQIRDDFMSSETVINWLPNMYEFRFCSLD